MYHDVRYTVHPRAARATRPQLAAMAIRTGISLLDLKLGLRIQPTEALRAE